MISSVRKVSYFTKKFFKDTTLVTTVDFYYINIVKILTQRVLVRRRWLKSYTDKEFELIDELTLNEFIQPFVDVSEGDEDYAAA